MFFFFIFINHFYSILALYVPAVTEPACKEDRYMLARGQKALQALSVEFDFNLIGFVVIIFFMPCLGRLRLSRDYALQQEAADN